MHRFDTGADREPVRRVALLSLHSSPLAMIGQGDAGGMNLHVRRLADELAREGLEVDVFTRRADRSTPPVLVSESGARFVHIAAGPARQLPKAVLPLHVPSLVAGLRSFVQEERRSYDIVHAHYWLSGLVAIRGRSFLNAPVLTMFHTLSRVKERYAGSPDRADSSVRADGERCVIRGSDVVVGATAEEESLMKSLYSEAPRQFEVIPPGVDLNMFQPRDTARCRRELGWDDGPIILFVGRFDPIKGLGSLLKSLAVARPHLPAGTKLIVAGGGHTGAAAFRKLARELQIDDIVDFHGLVPPAVLPTYYAAADICAVPSAYESFGLAAIEAMACGTPVVAFDVGGLSATVRHLQSGYLVEPGNIPAFGCAIVRALTNADREAMGRRARLGAEGYGWSASVAQTRALYESAADERHCFCQWLAGA